MSGYQRDGLGALLNPPWRKGPGRSLVLLEGTATVVGMMAARSLSPVQSVRSVITALSVHPVANGAMGRGEGDGFGAVQVREKGKRRENNDGASWTFPLHLATARPRIGVGSQECQQLVVVLSGAFAWVLV